MEDAVCKLCGESLSDYVGQWCFGCRSYICEQHPNDPWGSHNPEDHDKTGDEED